MPNRSSFTVPLLSTPLARTSGLVLALAVLPAGLVAQSPAPVPEEAPARYHPLPPLREQAKEQQAWLEARLERVLPALMAEYDVDMWILSMREYAEDPVFWSVTAPTTFAARRRSIYVFTRQPDGSLERLALGGTSQGGVFQAFRSTRPAPTQPTGELVGNEQWNLLRELVEDRDPGNIALNIDPVWAFSDGLHAGEAEALLEALGPEYASRVKREPLLAMNYISLRLPEMMPRYRKIMESVHAIISEAFSNSVITPGETTTEDVVWWMRQKLRDLGYTTWFQTSVDVQRAGEMPSDGPVVIQEGDLLWTDYGVVAQNLHTDTQHLGYVLRDGEMAPPAGLLQCLANSNRLQDILLENMEPGLTGNEILAATLAQMRSEGINGTVYTHPIGDHGHGAGPLIGRWDAQEGVPVRGDAVLLPNSWHSIELQATTPIPEWGGKPASCRQEEEAYLDEDGDRHWVFRRQSRLHLVW
ncbi:MAG: aminopeptidase P family protein [Gemmatimonadetes bacterium]|nr:M24 family metallopeptidase [Gemmatimonadota bacterium]NNF12175.1 aminopeptidase P family protein [Gemmatimonadota bacterium]